MAVKIEANLRFITLSRISSDSRGQEFRRRHGHRILHRLMCPGGGAAGALRAVPRYQVASQIVQHRHETGSSD